MRIGMVCYPTYGGSGIVATELGLALAEKGHEIHYIASSQPVRLDIFSDNVFYHQVVVPDYPLFKYQPYELALSSKMVDVALNCHLDLVHVHYAIPHAYAAYMAKKMLEDNGIKLPIVTTLHGTDITLVGQDDFYKPAVTFSINHSDAVTSVSESLKRDTLKHFDVHRAIDVIPNFIDFKVYDEVLKLPCPRKHLAEKHERVIMHMSNFRAVKRVRDVINVFKIISESLPSKLILIGEGPEIAPAEELVRKLGIQHKVRFMGNVSEVERLLCVGDLFILPSEQESFGLAALEAMAASTPVISSDTGGIPEVNLHGISGYLSPVGDVLDMAKNAIKILEHDHVLERFKKQAYSRAKDFELRQVLPKYEALYQRVVDNRLSLIRE